VVVTFVKVVEWERLVFRLNEESLPPRALCFLLLLTCICKINSLKVMLGYNLDFIHALVLKLTMLSSILSFDGSHKTADK
jgi:hypothetical protein